MAGAELRITPFAPADRAPRRDLVLAGLADRWGELDPTFNQDLDDPIAAHPGVTIVMARLDAEVVGTGALAPQADGQAEIMRMSVARRHRRMGVGEAILDHLVATASRRGVRTLVLETSTAWSDAVDFYLRRGFGITHRIEDGPDPSTFLRRDIGQP